MNIQLEAKNMTPIALKGIDNNIRKFLMLITFTEGTDRQKTPYNELYGYDNVEDLSKHPNIKVKKGKYVSTAFGRYQILYKTYLSLGIKDMFPETQDKACIMLIKRRKAYDDIISGNISKAIEKCSSEWASLPGSIHGQPTRSLDDCIKFWNSID